MDWGLDIVIEAFQNHKNFGDLLWMVEEYIYTQ